MMALRTTSDRLIDRLPKVRGRLAENAPLGPLTWFRVGGPADVLFRPADADDEEDEVRTAEILREADEAEVQVRARSLGRPLLKGLLESALHVYEREKGPQIGRAHV